jgi:phage-related protein
LYELRYCAFLSVSILIRFSAMIGGFKPIPLYFWSTASGKEPVREWLNGLPLEDRKVIGRDIAKVQFGWPVGLPLCRSLKGGLWEVRSSLPSRREARVLFGFHQGELVALHGFVKKAQATPEADLELARKRLQEFTA